MIRTTTICAALLLATTSFAHARPYHRHHHHPTHKRLDANGNASDPRPARWCAWWLRRHLSIPKSAFRPGEFNLAAAFRYIGHRVSGPAIDVIVVWPHHVGIITGHTDEGWVVTSGNDGHKVNTRVRSLRGVIAYRKLQSSFHFASASYSGDPASRPAYPIE